MKNAWTAALQGLLNCYEKGNQEARGLALAELQNLTRAADVTFRLPDMLRQLAAHADEVAAVRHIEQAVRALLAGLKPVPAMQMIDGMPYSLRPSLPPVTTPMVPTKRGA